MPGSIRHRADRWQASVETPRRADGRRARVYKSFKSEREANLWLSRQYVDVASGSFVAPSSRTVGEVLEEYLPLADVAVTTQACRRSYARRIKDQIGNVPMQRVTPRRLQEWRSGLATSPRYDGRPGGLMPWTITQTVRIVKGMFRWAVDERYIATNPAAHLQLSAQPEQRDMTILLPDELVEMLEMARSSTVAAAVWMAGTCGLRRGEVLGLRWTEDIDLERGTVTVSHALSRRTGQLRRGPAKTRGSRRTLRLPPAAREFLADYRQRQLERYGFAPEYVCPNARGGAWAPSTFSTAFRAFLRRRNLRPMRFHDLRHTHAAHLIWAGVHIKAISERLGHASITTTMNIYGHLLPVVEDEAIEKLHQLLQNAARPREQGSTST